MANVGPIAEELDEATAESPHGLSMTTLSRPTKSLSTRPYKRTFTERVESFISRLSTRNQFWHRVCSLIWLPYAFNSGIRMKRVDGQTFTAVLPFRRFNKNWYNAMAGAALLANSEIAGGLYLFAHVGEGFTVVCKELTYKFLRPCLGPAVYRVEPPADLQEKIAAGKEFNIEMDLTVYQQRLLPHRKHKARGGGTSAGTEAPAITKLEAHGAGKTDSHGGHKAEREIRVGRVRAVFHVTPKPHHVEREHRRPGTTFR